MLQIPSHAAVRAVRICWLLLGHGCLSDRKRYWCHLPANLSSAKCGPTTVGLVPAYYCGPTCFRGKLQPHSMRIYESVQLQCCHQCKPVYAGVEQQGKLKASILPLGYTTVLAYMGLCVGQCMTLANIGTLVYTHSHPATPWALKQTQLK